MKTSDVDLEEKILSFMMKSKKCRKYGLSKLKIDDFIAQTATIFPPTYNQYIFTLLSDHFTVIDFSLDILNNKIAVTGLPEGHVGKYQDLSKRIFDIETKSDDFAYFVSCVNLLFSYTKKRLFAQTIKETKTLAAHEDISGIDKLLENYLRTSRRNSAKREKYTIIDWKEDFENRFNTTINAADDKNKVYIEFAPLDINFGHLSKTELHIIASRTSGGKSAMMKHLSCNAIKKGYGVLYLTKEETQWQVATALDAHLTNIDHNKFREGLLTEKEKETWLRVKDAVIDHKLKIVGVGGEFSVDTIREVTDNVFTSGFDIDLVMVDYINLLEPGDSKLVGYLSIEKCVKDLKNYGQEYNVVVWSGAQLKPEAYEKDRLEVLDIAASKLGIAANVDGLYGLIRTTPMMQMNYAMLQIMKARGAGIKQEMFPCNTNFSRLLIDESWKAAKNLWQYYEYQYT